MEYGNMPTFERAYIEQELKNIDGMSHPYTEG
jgi:hypothetical protein